MTGSTQVVAALAASGLTLLGTFIASSAGSTPARPNITSISHSTVNQYYSRALIAKGNSAGNSSSCPSQKITSGHTQMNVFMDVKASGSQCWKPLATVQESAVVARFLVTYVNTSKSVQRDVAVAADLPPGMSLVPDSTFIYNSAYPKGTPDTSNNIGGGGVLIGSYYPRAAAYVVFSLEIPERALLSCGAVYLPVTAKVYAAGTATYRNSAVVAINNMC